MFRKNRTRRGAWSLATACLAGTSLTAFAQTLPMPPAGPAPVGNAINTGEPGRPATGEDVHVGLPASMPPLDQIPPMPMREGDPTPRQWNPADHINFVTMDKETGESQSIVVNRAFLGVEAQGPGYHGADGITGFESGAEGMGTMSILSAATRNTHPYRMNVKVAMRFLTNPGGADAWFVCSGSMIDAETVVLAAHCVYMRDDPDYQTGWAEEIYIFPGWDGVGDPTPGSGIYNNYGYARGTYYGAGSGYTNSGDFQADVGFVGVTRAVGFLTGWYGWNYGSSCATIQGRTYNNASYPAQSCGQTGLHNGRDMTFWDGTIDSCPDNRLQIDTTSGCYTAVWGGMSGSSMYYISGSDRYISAVCSTSNRSTSAHYCRLWEGIVNFMNDTIIPTTRGTTFDLQALDFNVTDTTLRQGDPITGSNVLFVNATNANPALETYTFRVYISTNPTISSSDTLIGTWLYNWDYAAMSTSRINIGEMTVPCNLAPGTYYIGAVLDSSTDGTSSNNDTSDWDAVQITITDRPAPGAPTSVIATDGTSCTSTTLTWIAPADAVSFQIWRNTVNNPLTATLIATDSASPYVDTSTVDGGRYYYWVKAVGPCGDVGPFNSSPGYGWEAAIPGVPTNVSATSTNCSNVTISWTHSSEADEYIIFRNTTNSIGTATNLGTDTASPFVDATAVAGTTYYYWVRASNICGTATSGSTTGVRILTPSAPTGLSASDGTNCFAVDLVWSAPSFAASYQIFRNTANNSAGAAQIGTSLTPSYADATAVAGTTYFYWVKAVNACGVSGFSGTNSGFRGVAVGAPVNVQATDGTSCTQVDVTWNPVANAVSYQVWRSTSSNPATALSIGTPAGTTFADGSAVPGTTYYYWVKAVGTCGAGNFSANNSGFRGAPPAAAPTGVTASDGTACNVVLVTWNSVNGAANYQVFRNTVNNSATATLLASPASTNYNDASAAANTTYFYWVKAASPCGTSGFSAADQGTRGSTATITNQPDSRTVLPGESVTFNVVAGGLNSYQWRRNGVNLTDDARITGSTSATLVIDPVVQADQGDYTVVVTNACGNVTSRRAVLRVQCPADLDDGSGTGTPDGGVTIEDLLYFLGAFADGNLRADLDDGSGNGVPDGGVTIEDLLYFLARFDAGC